MAFPHDAHRALLTDFLDAIEQDRSPRISGREALRVHHLIDAVLRASAEGRTIAVQTT
jgi:predicted dehydrogenase